MWALDKMPSSLSLQASSQEASCQVKAGRMARVQSGCKAFEVLSHGPEHTHAHSSLSPNIEVHI